jgi:hypothetical protein
MGWWSTWILSFLGMLGSAVLWAAALAALILCRRRGANGLAAGLVLFACTILFVTATFRLFWDFMGTSFAIDYRSPLHPVWLATLATDGAHLLLAVALLTFRRFPTPAGARR